MKNRGNFFSNPDKDIIDSIRDSGNKRGRGEEDFFNRYIYFIREGVQKYNLSEDNAFDAYADSVISAIQKITDGSFEGRSSLKTWLFQIFHNKCVDLIRKKTTNRNSVHRTETISEMMSHISDSAASIIQKLIEKADFDLLKEKLNKLGENCRQLLLQWADGYSDKEISAMMEYKTASVVKTSRLRCLEKLREFYKPN